MKIMRKYNVKFSEITTTIFEVEANNKKEAIEMAMEILIKTNILERVNKFYDYKFDVEKIKNGK